MGFTRSTTNTTVHQGMPDYPTSEGYTTDQLKTAFDAPATGLKTDLNGLMGELEATTAGGYLGCSPLDGSDASDDTVLAKLQKLNSELQGIALGDIPDGTITQAKLNSSFSATLGIKNGEVQTNLNAEMLGGETLTSLLAATLTNGRKTGTFQNEGETTYTLTLGFQPSVVFLAETTGSGVSGATELVFALIIGSKGVYFDKNTKTFVRTTATLTETGITLNNLYTGSGSSNVVYSYLAIK